MMSRITRAARPTEAPDSPGDPMPLEGEKNGK